YNREIEDRKRHGYPPFTRLIEVTLKHVDRKVCGEASVILADDLRANLQGVRILGPGEPMVAKIRNQYLMTILIKIPRGRGNLAEIKHNIQSCIDRIAADKKFRNLRVIPDVDPV